MIATVRRIPFTRNLWTLAMVMAVLAGAAYFGSHASVRWLALLVICMGAMVLLRKPILGLPVLVLAALLIPLDISTGTEVKLNPAALLVPALLGVWLLDMIRLRKLHLVPSRTTAPLVLFLLAGLLSLLVGIVLWDPAVPRSGNFTLVQLAQWAIFAFSAGAFWLTGNLVRNEAWLRRLTFFYLAVAGSLAILHVLPGVSSLIYHATTFALDRAPFWLLLIALAGGQLLFNRDLSVRWRLFLGATSAAVLFYALILERKTLSNLVGVVPVVGVLVWSRWPRWRWALVGLAVLSLLFSSAALYQFAGGNAEWEESGGSRLVLIGRVIEVSMRNPITGLGPAAYRSYARMRPLAYEAAYWVEPVVNSHNNYVDLFSQVGLLGLGLFFWYVMEVIRLGVHLQSRFTEGFAAGYVNAMLAAGIGSLAVMLFADWILPFVYNIGFPGFQASVLVWLFLGGLLALDAMPRREMPIGADHAT